MSTQAAPTTSLSLRSEDQQQHFRLLELPPELLTIIASEHPPILQLKSTAGLSGEPDGTAVLCTADKTFSVRQKNSSNTIYIYQPTDGAAGQDGGFPYSTLEAISQPHSTLETTPVAKSAAAAYIRLLLPTLATTGKATSAHDPLSKAQLFANIPFSKAECEAAFRELAAFESPSTGRCLLPSAQLKVNTWNAVLENMRASIIDITTSLEDRHFQVLRDGLEDLPGGLFDAVLAAITAITAISEDHTKFDRDRLVRWTGINQLEVTSSKSASSTSSFKQAWKDALPEPLRAEAELTRISDRTIVTEAGKSIAFKDYALDFEAGADGTGAAVSKSALGTKRTWHEKFRPMKKAG